MVTTKLKEFKRLPPCSIRLNQNQTRIGFSILSMLELSGAKHTHTRTLSTSNDIQRRRWWLQRKSFLVNFCALFWFRIQQTPNCWPRLPATGYPQPKLSCPSSVNVELHPNDTDHTMVKLRRPKTDVSWERDIVVEPYWAKKDVIQLPLGSINISYTAKHPVSKLTSSCTFDVHVIGEWTAISSRFRGLFFGGIWVFLRRHMYWILVFFCKFKIVFIFSFLQQSSRKSSNGWFLPRHANLHHWGAPPERKSHLGGTHFLGQRRCGHHHKVECKS